METMSVSRREFALAMLALGGGAVSRGVFARRVPQQWTTGRQPVPGGNVLWRATGNGPKAPLLLVHGGGGGGSGSKPFEQLAGLADERRLVTWDQLDAGESDRPRDPVNWRLSRFVDEMEIVRNALLPGPLHVMGGSWGSTLLMEWLVTKRPTNVLSVIFICPTLDSARADVSRRNAQRRLSPAARDAFETAATTGDFRNSAFAAANAEYQRTFIARRASAEMVGGPPDPAFVRALSVDMRNWNRTPDLRSLTQPVLFLRGEHDYITDDDTKYYASQTPRAEVETIFDAGHLAFVDDPEATTSAIRRFLKGVER